MSELSRHVADYLRLRRALGFKLERAGQLPPQLAAYLEAAGATTVTSDLAIAWARLPGRARPNHWAQRLAVARGFARYLQTIDPATEVPPAGVFPARRHRPSPCLWSERDLCRLLEAARALRPPLRAATHESLFGLLAVSGCASARRSGSSATTSTSALASSRSGKPSSAAPGSCRCTRRPPRRCPATPVSATVSGRGPGRGRSSSRASAPHSNAAAWTRRCGRSRHRSGSAPAPSGRGHMTSDIASLWPPWSAGNDPGPASTGTWPSCPPTSATSVPRTPTGITPIPGLFRYLLPCTRDGPVTWDDALS